MPRILSIDTSNTQCSVTLCDDEKVITSVSDQPRQHARRILPMIAELLAARKLRSSDLDAIAVVSGPGSFTGLRIGAGVAQGLAFGAGIPVIGVSALEVIAMKAHRACGPDHLLVCVRAREDEIYSAAYSVCGGQLTLQGREMVGGLSEQHFVGADETAQWFGVGDGWLYAKELSSRGSLIIAGYDSSEIVSDASTLSEIASLKWAQGEGVAPELALPVYLKEQLDYQPVSQQVSQQK